MTKQKAQKPELTNKSHYYPLVITAVLMILFFVGNSFGSIYTTGAVESSDTTSKIPVPVADSKKGIDAKVASGCVTALTAYADPEFEKYKIFMENNFKNKSSTSSLLDLGVKRYDLFKADITLKYQDLVGEQISLAGATSSPNVDQGEGLNKCNLLALKYVDDASKLLKMRVITTSNIKKTSIFVEKYKQINEKLRALSLDVSKMVVNISAFQQKLPCYLKSCA